MLKQAIEEIRARVLEISLATLGTALLPVAILVENHLAGYVSKADSTIVIRLIAGLTAITAYSWAAYFYLKPRIIFDNRLNVFRDIKTGTLYCPSCKTKNILSPLAKNDDRWRCVLKECRIYYDDPDRILPPKKEEKPKRAIYG